MSKTKLVPPVALPYPFGSTEYRTLILYPLQNRLHQRIHQRRSCIAMSSKDNLALDLEHGVRRWDRARWISVFSSHNPTIREVTECLGLGLSASSSTTNRGIPKFDNPDYRKLSSEVTKLSKELPKERDALLDFAADPQSLDHELEDLLSTYGPAIWGKDADRSCLLKPEPNKKTYNKDLFYEVPEHKEM